MTIMWPRRWEATTLEVRLSWRSRLRVLLTGVVTVTRTDRTPPCLRLEA